MLYITNSTLFLRLFVVVYKHLHTVVFDQGGEIYNVYKLSFKNLLHMYCYYNVLPEALFFQGTYLQQISVIMQNFKFGGVTVLGVQLFNKIKWKKKTKNFKKLCFAVFPNIFGKICYFCIYVLDIDDTRNGNNMKQKVKSEFSFNYWFNGDKP